MSRMKIFVKQRIGPGVVRHWPRRVDLPHAGWGLHVGVNGRLWLGDVDLEELARTVGTPLHVVDSERLAAAADEALAPYASDPSQGADIFYSYKTNPVPAVLRLIHARGVGAEVISPYELWLALRLEVAPDRIIYNGPAKSDESIRIAVRAGVLSINANSSQEAGRIARLAAEEGRTVNLGVRVSLPGMWGGQFGIASSSPEAIETIRSASRDPNVHLSALHVHRGEAMRTAEQWQGHVSSVLRYCDGLRRATGWTPAILDVGGSLACATVSHIPSRQFRLNRALGVDLQPPDPALTLSVAEASTMAASMVRSHFAAQQLAVPIVVQEPGRALTGSSQLLLSSVVDLKHDIDPPHAVLDAGMNIADPLPYEFHQLFCVSRPFAPLRQSYRLAGPICTPADVLYYNWTLPELERGDVLAVMDTGAYFVPFSTAFSFPRPAIVQVGPDGWSECRRRETFEDMVLQDGTAE